MVSKASREIPQMESLNRIKKIPVVETGIHFARTMYGKIKNSNTLVQWSFGRVEGGLQLAIDKSLVAVPIIEMPLAIVDTIVCKSLDTIEQRVPAIYYPPEMLINMTKDLVSTKLVQPVIKRADSVKQFGVQGATKYGEIAATHLDTALDMADLYVDKYLPDATDNIDSKDDKGDGKGKAIQTMEHVNRFSRKLQRRLTKRTIAEARALQRQGADTIEILRHLFDLAIKDPVQFADKMKTVWKNLSEDEPENQVPPANLEQLITMLTRECARRFVHLTNFSISTVAKMPEYTRQTMHTVNDGLFYLLDYINRTVNLEYAKTAAVARAKTEIEVLYDIMLQLSTILPQMMENIMKRTNKSVKSIIAPSTMSKETPNQNADALKEKSTFSKKENKKKKLQKETSSSIEDENSNKPPTIENGTTPNKNSKPH